MKKHNYLLIALCISIFGSISLLEASSNGIWNGGRRRGANRSTPTTINNDDNNEEEIEDNTSHPIPSSSKKYKNKKQELIQTKNQVQQLTTQKLELSASCNNYFLATLGLGAIAVAEAIYLFYLLSEKFSFEDEKTTPPAQPSQSAESVTDQPTQEAGPTDPQPISTTTSNLSPSSAA